MTTPRTLSLVCVLLCGAALASAASFSYQGRLTDDGAPAHGRYDLRFSLWDAAGGGTQLATVTLTDVAVRHGRFTVELDFGSPFDGEARWLGIEVRDGASTGVYTALTPRQPLTGTPHAQHASSASHAATANTSATAGDTDNLDGHGPAYYRAWANLVGVPGDLADGDSDVLAGLACDPGEVPAWSGSVWTCATDDVQSYSRTAVVGPVGDPAANGAALLAALAAIPTPTSQQGAWELRLEPGRYDLGAASLFMKPWLALTGSGQEITTITSSNCAVGSGAGGTLFGDASATIRDLTVENTCAVPARRGYAITFWWDADGGALYRVTARANGASDWNAAVAVLGDGVVLERVTAEASNASSVNYGISSSGTNALLIDCVGIASGGSTNRGLYASGTTWVRRGGFTALASAGSDVAVELEGSADLQEVTAFGADRAVDITSFADMTVLLSRLTTTGRVDARVSSGSLLVVVEHSRIVTSGATVYAGAGTTVRVAMSQLAGGAVSGTVGCAAVWDETWTFRANTCP